MDDIDFDDDSSETDMDFVGSLDIVTQIAQIPDTDVADDLAVELEDPPDWLLPFRETKSLMYYI